MNRKKGKAQSPRAASMAFLACIALVMVCVFTIVQGVPAEEVKESVQTILPTTEPTTIIPPSIPAPGTPLSIEYSLFSFLIVIALISILGILFILLIWWSNKLDQAGYLGTMYRDTIYDIEWKRRKEVIEQKKNNGEFRKDAESNDTWITEEKKSKLPDLDPEIAILRQNFKPERKAPYNPYVQSSSYAQDDSSYYSSYDLDFETQFENSLIDKGLKDTYTQYKKDLYTYGIAVEKEAEALYRKELQEGQKKANAQASDAVSIDMGVIRGKGSEFVLEFTTVVVIIFAAAILGVLQVLGTEQIGTLLAAIAGYVLGRATTKTKEGTTTTAPSSTVVDIINAVKGTAGNTPQTTAGGEVLLGTGGITPQGIAGTGQQGTAAKATPDPHGKP